MVVWMLNRGMGFRNTFEMAAVMLLLVIPFPVPGLVRYHRQRTAWVAVLDNDLFHARPHALPA